MRFAALATDYDGTLAHEGLVSDDAVQALGELRSSGRRLILVTGRTLDSLRSAFSRLERFDLVVAENGGTLYNPSSNEEKVLAEPPSDLFLQALYRRGVSCLEVGHVIAATAGLEKENVLDAIREVGLELQIIFNKGSLMVLPAGCNKASGLQAAAAELGISLHSIAAIGDAENDHALLASCEFSAAVANALPALKQRVELITRHADSAGVIELIEHMIQDDLSDTAAHLGQPLTIGKSKDGGEIVVPACSVILLAGASGGGKSTLTTAFMEGLGKAGYQFCAIDPEGDYEQFEQALVLGNSKQAPQASDVIKALEKPSQSVVVNLLAVEAEKRPSFFQSLFLRLQELRGRTGRPHCVVVDEAHHFFPELPSERKLFLPESLWGLLFITVSPERLPAEFLRAVQMLALTGEDARKTLEAFCSKTQCEPPPCEHPHLDQGHMLGWRPGSPHCFSFTPVQSEMKRTRHRRKYAEGELSPDRSFYFRGPQGKLNLRAANLMTFLNLMEGVDDETWLYHLRNHDFSDWFEQQIKDEDLARQARDIERDFKREPGVSRQQLRSLIMGRYTVPA
jgi:hydroxymethylpyrimidine pyrophosphatase-like HAD family hydrolase